MLSKRYLHLIRLFAIISLSYFLAGCGDGDGPTPVPGEPCPVNGVVSFDAESYAESASSALISLTDTCIANRTVVVKVDNGTETINLDVPVDIAGKGAVTVLNFGPTSPDTATIAIQEGDLLTVTYTGASTVVVTDTADITAVASTTALGVYTETYTDPVLSYSDILNAADLGGKDTATDEVTSAVIDPLDGVNSLRAAFKAENTPPSGGDYNGFVFDFGPALINGTFEADDASGGNVAGATGWTDFENVFTNNTAGPGFGPVSHDVGGSQSLTMFGPFTFDSASGAYQPDNTVEAGSTYTASVHVMNWAPDPIAAGNLGIFQLSFWSAPGGQTGGGTNLGTFEVIVDSTDDGSNIYLPPQDGGEISDWTQLSITEIAPAGTASAEIFLLHIQLNTDPALQAGSIFWDDVSIVKGAVPSTGPGGDISSYEVLRFGMNSTAATSVLDLEVKLEDTSGNAASVFLSDYTSTPDPVAGWDLYEIPLVDFPVGVDLTKIISLGFFNASSTVTGATSVAPTLVDATLYFDNVHFATGDAGAPPVLTGLLVDAPVEGVTFETPTQSGVTNNLGEFKYILGETVIFSVGGIELGRITGAPLITPVELTGGANPIDQTAINQLVFLQSIDEDQDPSNGVTVSAATLAAAATQTLDFTLDSAGFTSAVAPVITAITSVNPTGPNAVVSETTALDNFYVTYVTAGGTDTFSWSFPPQYPPYPGVASFPVDFEDANGPYYITDFEGGNTTIINNPQSGGTNTSAKVAQMQKFASTEVYGGSKLTLGEIDFSSNPVVSMKVWASREVPVTLVLESSPNVERVATHSGSSTWEELTFDYTGFAPAGVREVTVIFDVTEGGDAANDAPNWTFYYDDIALQASAPISYQLIWSDEFDVDGVPDTDNWTIETGYGPNNDGWGNQEWQLYTTSPDNIRVENDNLVITADCPTAPACGVRDDTVTSGKVNSLNKFSFRYGKVEAKIKPPVGKASWPAFWMLGKNFPDVGWPFTGEVDIVEMFQTNGSNPQTTHFTIHWCDETKQNPATPDVCFPANEGWTFYSDQLELGQSLGDDYHIFSAEWDAAGITGKIDGVPYFYKAIDPGTMDEFLKEFFLILNVAMGGTLGSNVQPPDGSETWPQIMLVDYVRVYQDVNNSESTSTIGGGTPPDPLGVYSETNTNPAIAYSEIINVADYGGKNTVTNENSSDTVLEGAVSLRADFISTGSGLNYNGFVFNFASVATSGLTNASFETPDASAGDVTGAGAPWNSFNSNFTVSNLINNTPPGSFYNPDAHSGTQLLKQFGTDAGSFQDLPASPGETWQASAWAQSWAGDPNNNTGLMQIFFRDAADTNLCDPGGFNPCNQAVFDTSQPVDTWVELTTSAVAPAGTTTARIQLILVPDPLTPANGSLFWDDASLSAGSGGSQDADISGYEVLKFGINTAAASGLMDLEIKMEDSASAAASVFLSAYTPSPSGVSGWDLYEIPLSDFTGIDQTRVALLGYWSASSTVTGSTAVAPTLLDGTLYFDDIHFDQASTGGGGGVNLLTNASFETPDASAGDVPGAGAPWNSFNSNFTVSNLINNNPPGSFYNPDAQSGTQLLKQFGTDAGSFQDLPASPGETWEASAWAQSWAGDPNNNTGLMQIFYRDAADTNLCDPGGFNPCNQAVFDTSQPVDTWVELTTSAVAPAGTTTVRIQLILVPDPLTPANGSLFWDDASLSKVAP